MGGIIKLKKNIFCISKKTADNKNLWITYHNFTDVLAVFNAILKCRPQYIYTKRFIDDEKQKVQHILAKNINTQEARSWYGLTVSINI